ncbi:hypothetical protein MMC28_000710 [Mycoblastus sanguinarius]|nr:hypothetical protein [Mycoblastus sanguinarius]
MTASAPNDDPKSIQIQDIQTNPRKSSDVSRYVPGGQIYRDMVANARNEGNPRNGTPMKQWLRDWEKTWEGSGDKDKPATDSKL